MSKFFVPDNPKHQHHAIGEYAILEYERLREENKKLLRQVIDLTELVQRLSEDKARCPPVTS